MAYTSLIPVRRLDRAVEYIRDKSKTVRKPKSLQEAVDYFLGGRLRPEVQSAFLAGNARKVLGLAGV